jgi:hypothetical protein
VKGNTGRDARSHIRRDQNSAALTQKASFN